MRWHLKFQPGPEQNFRGNFFGKRSPAPGPEFHVFEACHKDEHVDNRVLRTTETFELPR